MIPEKQAVVNMQQFYRQVKGVWNSIYPIYFNSNKSLSEGRRVSKQYAVEEPTLEQLSYAVGMCRIKNIIEPHKAYSRDFLERGRLKVQIFDKQGKPVNSQLKIKKMFMIEVRKKLKQYRAQHLKK